MSSDKQNKPTVRFKEEEDDEPKKKALNELDKDISKLWKDLQELENFPSTDTSTWPKTSNTPPKYPATPVKIKTYNTNTNFNGSYRGDLPETRPGSIRPVAGSSLKSLNADAMSKPFGSVIAKRISVEST